MADYTDEHRELHNSILRQQAEQEVEDIRAQRHHEVFLAVIKIQASQLPWPPVRQSIEDRVDVARTWADIAYPKLEAK